VEAPGEIVTALHTLNTEVHPDVILLARGGGSMEDLWAFNDERVVFAVAESEAPVITGIGHETDFTLADFAADLRAPTPTGAAVAATPSRDDLSREIENVFDDIYSLAIGNIDSARAALLQAAARLNRESPLRRVERERQQVDMLSLQIGRSLSHRMTVYKAELENRVGRLSALNPQGILQRGYALVRREDGMIVRSADQISSGDHITTTFSRGSAISRVESTRLD
jgi:exodeoxyribonuclease VII large subunit